MYFTLRGKSKKGNKEVYFSLKDSPNLLDENSVILRNIAGSPILDFNSIRRCSNIYAVDGKNIAEGDILKPAFSENSYTVIFDKGFKVCDSNNKLIPLKDLRAPIIVGEAKVKDIETSLHFQYGETDFWLQDILGTKGPYIIINRKYSPCLLLKRVNQLTGLRDSNNKKLALGRIVTLQDGRLAPSRLYKGQISVFIDSGYKELSELNDWIIKPIYDV